MIEIEPPGLWGVICEGVLLQRGWFIVVGLCLLGMSAACGVSDFFIIMFVDLEVHKEYETKERDTSV
jgi:hypothetical protein